MGPSPNLLSSGQRNRYVAHLFQGYIDLGLEDYPLWDAINCDFEDWKEEHWISLDSDTWDFVRKCCYTRGLWIDHGIKGMIKAVSEGYNEDWKTEDWTMQQILWVENHYGTVSRGIRQRQQELLRNADAFNSAPAEAWAPPVTKDLFFDQYYKKLSNILNESAIDGRVDNSYTSVGNRACPVALSAARLRKGFYGDDGDRDLPRWFPSQGCRKALSMMGVMG